MAKEIDIRNKDITLPDNFVNDVRTIIEQGRQQAYAAAGQAAIATFWNVGRRIVEEEQAGKVRAEYGSQLIPMLAEQLTKEYGNGYGRRNLAYYRQFYLTFNDLEILHTRVQNLTWSHIRRILSVANQQAREWYFTAASEQRWSVRELDRNIFVIFELKTHRLTHQDIGQLDMYVRMYDDLVKGEDDQPTIGVLLCTDTDNTIARYSVLHESEQLFAAKYMTYMPTEEELRREIEQQKQFFLEQHKNKTTDTEKEQ